MPIYEYEPTVFSANEPYRECCYFEELQSFSAEPVKICPSCSGQVHRVLSLSNHVLKTGSNKSESKNSEGDLKTKLKGMFDGVGEEAQNETALFSKSADSQGKRAARLAARHMCGAGCRH
jgi:predicted nucleic acid-binding Zn ribbon protein